MEETHLGLGKFPTFQPESEDDLDALPAGFIGECKNKTRGGPLPTEQWCYIHKAGNLDNYSNNPNRKGGVIRLVCIWDSSNVWTGAKYDDGTKPNIKYTWARDYNTLYKPTPADIGALAKDQNGADIPNKPLFVKTLGIVDTYPAGCPIPYPGPTAPDGYLLMDGRPFSTALYPRLAKLYPNGLLPDLRGMFIRGWDNGRLLDTPNGYKGALRSIVGDAREDTVNTKEFYSLRGYRIYIDNRNVPYEDKRGLLKPQYLDSIISDREPDTNRLLHMDHYGSPSYPQTVPSGLYQNDNECLEYRSSASGIYYYRRTATGAFIPNYKDNGMVRLGSPNVAFNYITKAA